MNTAIELNLWNTDIEHFDDYGQFPCNSIENTSFYYVWIPLSIMCELIVCYIVKYNKIIIWVLSNDTCTNFLLGLYHVEFLAGSCTVD